MLDTFFGGSYYINLDRRPDLNEYAKQQHASVGITPERIAGWDISPMSGEFPHVRSKGHVGCTMSHMIALMLAKHRNLESVLILEDDATFAQDALERWAELEPNIPEDWDVLFLGSWVNLHNEGLTQQIAPEIYRTRSALLTHAYAVHSRVYDKILSEIATGLEPVDQIISSQLRWMNAYSIHPMIAYQHSHFSETDYVNQPQFDDDLML